MIKKETIIHCIVFTILFIIIYFLIYVLSYKVLKYFFKEKIEGFTAEINKFVQNPPTQAKQTQAKQTQAKQTQAKQTQAKQTQAKNIILLGDSILNNSAYVKKEETIHQLLLNKIDNKTQQLYYMPKDGAVIAGIYEQISNIPADVDNAESTYFFLSVGGNDILNTKKDIKSYFSKYKKLIKAIQTRFPSSKLFLLNIYLPPTITPAQKTAITEWNSLLYDFVTHLKNNIKSLIAINYKLNQNDDFILGIEPSFQGGQKIVEQIVKTISSN